MYSFDSRVRYSECDERGRLSLVTLVNYLQDCSTFHSEALGLGLEHMRRQHFAWLIAAWQIEVRHLPGLGDPITVSTWCYEARRTQAGRNFSICAPDGTPHVLADSVWFTFDTKRCRPIRIPDSERAYEEGDERLGELPPTERKLTVDGPFTEAESLTVGTQHLDTNGHVNNAQYVRMAVDALGSQVEVRRLCVQYRRMALLGNIIVPRVHDAGDQWTVDLAAPEGDSYAIVRLDGIRG